MNELGYICADCGRWYEQPPFEGMAFWRCSDCDGSVGPVDRLIAKARGKP